MFGLSFGEITLLIIVGIVVVGPKNLPGMMRTAGRWVAKLRRMSSDLRYQSGIDEVIREEGLEQEIHELRSLSRGNVLGTIMTPVAASPPPVSSLGPTDQRRRESRKTALREREYPLLGCDSYDALPDDAAPYRPRAAHQPNERDESAQPAVAEVSDDRIEAAIDLAHEPSEHRDVAGGGE